MALRVGIAGFGLAGRVFHAPLVAATPGLALAAVLTRSPERAAQARDAHPGVRVVAELPELLEACDVLVVATPNRAHVEVALAGLERGLPVVVDKPLASTAAEARRLLAAPERVTVFQNRRWDADFLTAERLVREDALGRIVRFESRFERFAPEVDPERWRERPDPEEGGGVLLDLGAHLVDQAVRLLGPPVAVYGEVDRRRPGARVDDDAFVALAHEGGARSHLWMSKVAPLHGPRLRLGGLRSGFACDGLDPQEAQLAAGLRPGAPGWGEAPDGRLGDRPVALERGRYEAFYAGVRDWVLGAAPAPVDPRDGVRALELLEAAGRSAREGVVVHLGDGP